MSDAVPGDELSTERRQIARLYHRLDELRERTARSLDSVRRSATTGTPQAISERDAFDALYSERLRQLRSVEDRLCFGRLDLRDGEQRYIGRIGLSDDAQQQLLVDWRAPAAEAFYQATAAVPDGVVRRRHLSTRGREVTSIEDEVLDLDALNEQDAATVSGDGALLVALNASRTGRMRDIVATIQAEQDRVVRSPLPGILVVQGGPGTGKTAVALHRTAYLLYTYRDQISRSGVLLVGPNQVFLRYIEQVLPSLGETGVVMATPGQLFPGVDAVAGEEPAVVALKGDRRMARVVAEAVRQRQRVPATATALHVEGTIITLQPHDVQAARDRARRTHRTHNIARVTFVREILRRLAGELARAEGQQVTADNRAELDAALRASRDVRREVNRCWMPLTPQRLLDELYSNEARLAEAGTSLTNEERLLLRREPGAPWTTADVPLLDEAAELLGEDDSARRAEQARGDAAARAEVTYARGVLAMTGAPAGMVTADALAARYAGSGAALSVADRAADDREWTFSHIVVDEAQELSPMQWRLLWRRCPSMSMTVVGDVAQTSALAGVLSWADVFEAHAAGRWRAEELTVNYRTPSQIMAVAADVLAAAHPGASPPTSARDALEPPLAIPLLTADFAQLVAAVRSELTRPDSGSVAVITPLGLAGLVFKALSQVLPADKLNSDVAALDAPVSVLTVTAAKGLEFDAVMVLEPAALIAESPRGLNDLYVALTRPTQRLTVFFTGELPTNLRRLRRQVESR